MRYTKRNEDFAILFKKYRLRSGIKTLLEFADLLAEEKFVYDASLFAKWQTGERVPKDRRLLCAILNVFVKEGGMTSLEEANKFLTSVGASSLTFEESEKLAVNLKTGAIKTLPPPPQIFIRNDSMIKARIWDIMNQKHLFFYSMPGMGKTQLALYLANTLKRFFLDGIFWFNSESIKLAQICDTLLEGLGSQGYLYRRIDEKIEKLHEKVTGKTLLLVLDNVESANEEVLRQLALLPVSIIATSNIKMNIPSFSLVEVPAFSLDEFDKFCENVLGSAFFKLYQKQLEDLGSSVEFLPLSVNILAKHLHKKPISVLDYQALCKRHKSDLKMLGYDNKNLFIAIHLIFKNLSPEEQDLLIISSIFEERVFPMSALASILKKRSSNVKRVLKSLISLSLADAVDRKSLHIHSVIRSYLKSYASLDRYLAFAHFYAFSFKKLSGKKRLLNKFLENNIKTILSTITNLINFGSHDNALLLYFQIREFMFSSKKYAYIMNVLEDLAISVKKSTGSVDGLSLYLSDIAPIYLLKGDVEKLIEDLKYFKNYHNSKLPVNIQESSSLVKAQALFEKGLLYASNTAFKPLMKKGSLLASAYMLLIALKRKDKDFYLKYADKIFRKNPYGEKHSDHTFYILGCVLLEEGRLLKSYSYFEKSYIFAKKNGNIYLAYKSAEKICHLSKLIKNKNKVAVECAYFEEIKKYIEALNDRKDV